MATGNKLHRRWKIPTCLYDEKLIKDLYDKNGNIAGSKDYNFDFIAGSTFDRLGFNSNSDRITVNEAGDGVISAKIKVYPGTQTLYVDTFENPYAIYLNEEYRYQLPYTCILFPESVTVQQTDEVVTPDGNESDESGAWGDIDSTYLAIAPEYNYYTEDSFKEFLSTGDESILVENTSRKQLPKDLVLPSELYGYDIIGLVPYALRGYEEVEYVYVPQTYTELDATALSNTNIKEIVIRDGGLITVNASAFDNNTELEIITLPEAIVTIPSFTGCPKLKEIATN